MTLIMPLALFILLALAGWWSLLKRGSFKIGPEAASVVAAKIMHSMNIKPKDHPSIEASLQWCDVLLELME